MAWPHTITQFALFCCSVECYHCNLHQVLLLVQSYRSCLFLYSTLPPPSQHYYPKLSGVAVVYEPPPLWSVLYHLFIDVFVLCFPLYYLSPLPWSLSLLFTLYIHSNYLSFFIFLFSSHHMSTPSQSCFLHYMQLCLLIFIHLPVSLPKNISLCTVLLLSL